MIDLLNEFEAKALLGLVRVVVFLLLNSGWISRSCKLNLAFSSNVSTFLKKSFDSSETGTFLGKCNYETDDSNSASLVITQGH